MKQQFQAIGSMFAMSALFRPVDARAVEPESYTVFDAAYDGYRSIRISSMVVTKCGTELAFAEGWAANADQIASDINLKRRRDDGTTRPVKIVLQPGGFGYSMLTRLPDGTAGGLFKPNDAKRIILTRFAVAWLEAEGATKTVRDPEEKR